MTLGEQIRQARENKNLSQEELADQLGVSRQAVSKWENDSSIPQGMNRELLSKLLELEHLAGSEEDSGSKRSAVMWLGWGIAALLLLSLSVSLWFNYQKSSGEGAGEWVKLDDDQTASPVPHGDDSPVDHYGDNLEQEVSGMIPTVRSVTFYDSDLQTVHDTAGWYNSAEIDTILIQWEGKSPDNIKIFYKSGNTEETKLLKTKKVLEGDTAALFGIDVLESYTQGHFWFELDYGEEVVISDTYNIFYEQEYKVSPRIMYYIKSIDDKNITVDAVEWVDVPSRRAAELEIEENESGFFIYNEEELLETLALTEDCKCTILDWTDSFVPKDVTMEELLNILTEREGTETPYILTIKNSEIVEFIEQYVP